MKVFFIEITEKGFNALEPHLISKIRRETNSDNIIYNIYRDDDYFTNTNAFRRTLEEQSEAFILTNDDRMLSQFNIKEVEDLYFWNYDLNKFISYKEFYPNIRQVNNIEAMWRKRVFPDEYYGWRRN
jgi:hypothetical protein